MGGISDIASSAQKKNSNEPFVSQRNISITSQLICSRVINLQPLSLSLSPSLSFIGVRQSKLIKRRNPRLPPPTPCEFVLPNDNFSCLLIKCQTYRINAQDGVRLG